MATATGEDRLLEPRRSLGGGGGVNTDLNVRNPTVFGAPRTPGEHLAQPLLRRKQAEGEGLANSVGSPENPGQPRQSRLIPGSSPATVPLFSPWHSQRHCQRVKDCVN